MDGTEDEEIGKRSRTDPFTDIDELDGDEELYYADDFERQQAEIAPEFYEAIFGESDSEDFYGF